MKKKIQLCLFPSFFIFIIAISKLLLNFNNLEFMSWIYYFSLLILMIYSLAITNYLLIKKETYSHLKIISINFIGLIVFGIIATIISNFIGTNYQLQNKNFVHERFPFDFKPNNYVYEYKNFIIRGTDKLKCIAEMCD